MLRIRHLATCLIHHISSEINKRNAKIVIREKGWVIDTVCVDRKKGLFTYQLKELPKVDKSSYMKAYTKHLDNASANMEVL